jgi:ABC-2 type transport system permease protein
MRSVLEEKSSRVMEVLLSAVTAKELMAGKIVGVGAVGLTQLAVWSLMGLTVAAPAVAAMREQLAGMQLNLNAVIYFFIFFILGYLLYSSLFAALGAMVNTEQEAQNLQFFVMLPLILSTVLMMLVMRQPDSTVSMVSSLFPFCTPILMYIRILVQQPPMWQILLSIGLLIATNYGVLVVCSRIYRVGILMYGKRPTLPELAKWLRYA